jgi:hypothetical protein
VSTVHGVGVGSLRHVCSPCSRLCACHANTYAGTGWYTPETNAGPYITGASPPLCSHSSRLVTWYWPNCSVIAALIDLMDLAFSAASIAASARAELCSASCCFCNKPPAWKPGIGKVRLAGQWCQSRSRVYAFMATNLPSSASPSCSAENTKVSDLSRGVHLSIYRLQGQLRPPHVRGFSTHRVFSL